MGDSAAGVQTAIPVRSGSVDYFAAEVQVGDYLITLSGLQMNRNGSVVLDRALIGEVLAHAVAKLTAAAG